MTSRRSILLSLVLGAFLGIFGFSAVYAQVPRSISYQGLLVKNNQPVNAQVNLHVKIYDAAGQMLYEESYNQVQITNGIFNVLLGGNSGTLPANLKFDEQYFLGIDVDNTGEVTPKTPFVAAPYALNAQTVGGIGVSVTPQAGMLLPLDANGKIPKAVLPAGSQTTLMTIDGIDGDPNSAPPGNIKLIGAGGININDDVTNHRITISASGGGSLFPDKTYLSHFRAGQGMQVILGQGDTSVMYGIAPNGITSTMLGTGVVRGINIDQFVAGNGLFQDNLGNLNIGHDNSISIVPNANPAKANGAIGLNMLNTNTWLVLQIFNGGLTVNGTTTLNGTTNQTGPLNITGNETLNGNLVVNGTPEPNVANAAAVGNYEIIDNGDMRIVGATNLVGNTFLNQTLTVAGNSTLSGTTNVIGTALSSTNTVQGATNNMTGGVNNLTGTTNNVNASTNNMGTVAGQANNIGTGGASVNTIGVAGSGTNSIQGTTTNIGTAGASTNTIGTAGSSVNTIQGATNNSQANAINIGTTVASSVTTIGNANTSVTSVVGLSSTVNATTNNLGTNAGSANNIGSASSITNFSGNVIHNGNSEPNAATAGSVTNYELRDLADFQVNGATNLIGNVFMNQTLAVAGLTTLSGGLTIVGPLTQSGGNATINGGAANVFGSVGGSTNAIGAAGSTNTYSGQNNFNGNINQTSGTSTLLNTQVNGTLGSTGNLTLGTISSNNVIGNAGAINTINGSSNNLTGGTNNLTGTVNNVNASTNNVGNNSGSVNNIGTVSGGGISTNNIGNLTVGTNNNIKGLTTFQYSTTGNSVLITGGPTSCAGVFPSSANSQLFADGDAWFGGTVAACRLNIFGLGGSCITNLNTTNFGSCGGAGVPINLIASIIGVPNGVGATDLTNMRNIQAQNSIQTNTTLTIGTTGTNATNITSSNPGPGAINQQTPSVSGKLPTFQQYQLALVPGTGPNGGGAVTFTTINAPGLNFDANTGISVNYRSHNVGFPTGALWVTQTLTTVTVESSAAGDNNTVQIIILRP